jgi:hypothetical protein
VTVAVEIPTAERPPVPEGAGGLWVERPSPALVCPTGWQLVREVNDVLASRHRAASGATVLTARTALAPSDRHVPAAGIADFILSNGQTGGRGGAPPRHG